MADMVDAGYHAFMAWSRQNKAENGECWYNRMYGPFNPDLSAVEANRLADHVSKITELGQAAFMRGWEKAQSEYLASTNP